MRLPLWVGVAAALAAAGCGGRPLPDDDGRDPADAAAEAARLEATPLTKPVLPPLSVPAFAVSAVAARDLSAEPAVAYVARRPSARSLEAALAAAAAELAADPAVRAAVAGPTVVVYHHRPADLDRSFDVEVAVVVRPGTTPKTKGVRVGPLPAMTAMAVTFAGPPAAIDKAYDVLVPAVQASPRRPTGEVREVYAHQPGGLSADDDDDAGAFDAGVGDGAAGTGDGSEAFAGPTSPRVEVLIAVGVER